MSIKYCCFFCSKLNGECIGGYYDALGGKEYFTYCYKEKICPIENYECKASFVKKNKECWVEKK